MHREKAIPVCTRQVGDTEGITFGFYRVLVFLLCCKRALQFLSRITASPGVGADERYEPIAALVVA